MFLIDKVLNDGDKIDDSEPIKNYLTKIIRPYFKSYYRIAVNIAKNSINSYDNYISNLIMFKEIKELLK